MSTPPALSQSRQASRSTHAVQALAAAFVFITSLVLAGASHAGPDDAMLGLDEHVQEIKSDVLAIATELRQLEEKLLYPSDTQVAVFVSLAEDDALELDSLHLTIDGQVAAGHIYSFKELEALRKGGVQRLYTGNLSIGEHRIEVKLAGTLPGGARLDSTQSFSFTKEIEPRMVGLTLAGQASGDEQVKLGIW